MRTTPPLACLLGPIAVLIAALPPCPAADTPSPSPSPVSPSSASGPWTIARRSISEGRGANRYWQVDYTVRNDGPTPLALRAEQVAAEVDGWVSNSRVASHAYPRHTHLVVSGAAGASSASEVISSSDESRRCRERGNLLIWPAEDGEPPPEPVTKGPVRPASRVEPMPAEVVPGGSVRVRLRLEHEHFLYGPHDPLLGPRSLDLTLGSARIGDTLPLDRATRMPRASLPPWPPANDPPSDRRDSRVFVTAPDSLHLQAHVPGEQSYHFPECPVRYSTRMRLRYYYLIAPGTEGECRARIVQYKDAPTAWKILGDGDVGQTLSVVGRWVKVERIFRTEPEATTLTLEFCVRGDIGEMWIDDVSLEPEDDDDGGP